MKYSEIESDLLAGKRIYRQSWRIKPGTDPPVPAGDMRLFIMLIAEEIIDNLIVFPESFILITRDLEIKIIKSIDFEDLRAEDWLSI